MTVLSYVFFVFSCTTSQSSLFHNYIRLLKIFHKIDLYQSSITKIDSQVASSMAHLTPFRTRRCDDNIEFHDFVGQLQIQKFVLWIIISKSYVIEPFVYVHFVLVIRQVSNIHRMNHDTTRRQQSQHFGFVVHAFPTINHSGDFILVNIGEQKLSWILRLNSIEFYNSIDCLVQFL